MKKRCFPGIDPDRLKKEKEKKHEPDPNCSCEKCADTGKVVVHDDRLGLIIQSCPDCPAGEQRKLDNAVFRRMFR